jgi:hypothetical protein
MVPLKIYAMKKDELLSKFNIKSYDMLAYSTESVRNNTDSWNDHYIYNASIAVQLSVIYFHDISLFKSNSHISENFVVKQLTKYVENEKGITN